MSDYYKYPRLYLNASFSVGGDLALGAGQAHYLRAVLRKNAGDYVRVFNGMDGEWLAQIRDLGKKAGTVALCEKIRGQAGAGRSVTLYFAPIKKMRLEMMIEKAVELGVGAFVPVITNRTVHRKINMERLRMQIVEAAEQCERLDVPVLHEMIGFDDVLDTALYACLERCAQSTSIRAYDFSGGAAFLIGPEGGFDDQERERLLSCESVSAVSLGSEVLRSETAALAVLSYALLS